MKLMIDTANISEIKEMVKVANFIGVTSNPTLLAKESEKDTMKLLREIKDFLGDSMEMHVQVVKRDATEIIKNAEFLVNELGNDIFIKIPLTKEGAKAIKNLKKRNFKITATAIYSIQQVYIACNLDVDYIAPYVNRMHNLSINGTDITKDMQDLINQNNYNSKLLAASFKNTEQVTALAKHGIYSATIPYEIFEQMFHNDIVDCAIDKFIDDFNAI